METEMESEKPWITCPECGSSTDLSTVEKLIGTAHFLPEGKGELNYTGTTEVDWDGQYTNTNAKGEWEFWCHHCNHNWFQAVPEPEVPDGTGEAMLDEIHRPGPWTIVEGAEFGEYWLREEEEAHDGSQSTANARLMSHAPEMAQALLGLLEWQARMGGFENGVWDDARAALYAARGGGRMKHTPAPWERKWDPHHYRGSSIIISHPHSPENITICQMAWDDEMPFVEHEANADLIAAAPELANVLIDALYLLSGRPDGERRDEPLDVIGRATLALQKAGIL